MTKETEKQIADFIEDIKKLDHFIEITNVILKEKNFTISNSAGDYIKFLNNNGLGMDTILKAISSYNFKCKFYKEEFKKKIITLLYET